jgi:3-oxoadipate enol-lactonase
VRIASSQFLDADTRKQNMPLAPIDDIELYYEVHGSGPPLVLAHGGGSNHLTWWPQVVDLMDEYSVIVFDHRGFCHSTTGTKGIKGQVDDLRGLLDHLKIERAALLGQSLGGYTMAGFASRYSQRVTALILASGSAALLPMPQGGHSQRAASDAGSVRTYEEWLMLARSHDRFYKRDPKKYLLFEEIGRLNFRYNPNQFNEARKYSVDIAPIIAAEIPTLLIAGEEDELNCKVMMEIQKLIPKSRFRSVAECAHHLFFERPEICNPIVREFLRENRARLT